MSGKRKLTCKSVWDQGALLQAFSENGIKHSHAHRLWGHLIRHPEATWTDVPDLPKAAVALLDSQFSKFTTTVLSCKQSADGDTTKLLLQLQDGMEVEAVIMSYDTTARYMGSSDTDSATGWGHKRATLCVSSQVGCQMGCTFCATGTMGLRGNLTCGEILEQLVHANVRTRVRNIVFMGMGEPLNNYEQVKQAVSMMTDSRFFGLSKRHVTVSTVGVVPRILSLAEDLPGVSLALSLHAPNQELRQQIVPSARAYKLEKLMAAVDTYMAKCKQKVFVEYVVLRGVNDNLEQAHELGQLLQGKDVVVNLIPWNPVYSPDGPAFEAPDADRVTEFQATVRGQYGVHCTVRQEKGQDISGACGQLVVEHNLSKASSCGQQTGGGAGAAGGASGGVKDIEELGAAVTKMVC